MPHCYQCGEPVIKVKIKDGRVMWQACLDHPPEGPSQM